MKLWQKKNNINKKIENFTIGEDYKFDLILAPYDVIGSIAHVKMLENINIINKNELFTIVKFLRKIYFLILKKKFKIDKGVEDIHSQIEFFLIKNIGDLGKKIHSGRSRNDQILVDLKLFIRDEVKNIVNYTNKLFNILISLSEQYKNFLVPGYTHYQIAMPSSFGLWFSSYAESLVDDIILLKTAYKIINKNPLGSGAGYGSSLPLNRKMTTELLGFEDLNYNVIYAQMCRGKTERIISMALSSISHTLIKFSQDICLYINQNFGFISFPEELTTGSSIMPHKKNPDVFELIRAHCNKILSLSNEISLITTNLPSGYHRDLQIIKESFIPTFSRLKNCLKITKYMLENIIIKKDILLDKKYNNLFSVEAINKLVEKGIPFRKAYITISKKIENNDFFSERFINNINHSHEGSIGNLCNNQIKKVMKKTIKSFNFKKVENAINNLLIDNGKNLS